MFTEGEKNFSFPYAAYEIQMQLMNAIYQCLEDGKIGIFESPTGTGKSLSTICSVMSWLESFEKRERASLEEECRIAHEKDSNEDDWIAAYRDKFNAEKKVSVLEKKLESMKKVDEKLRNIGTSYEKLKRRYVNSEDYEDPPMIEDSNDEFALLDYSSDDDHKQCEEEELSCLKIIYATRTHSQLEQFVGEIMKTRFRPRMVTLASRQTLCLNDKVRSLKISSIITEKCNELRENKSGVKVLKINDSVTKRKSDSQCPFYNSSAIEDLSGQILTIRASTVPKVIDYGRRVCGCPYFASRKAVSLCQIVLVPYQVLLHKETRKAWNVSLRNNVVIIDEAHNLLQTIASVYSAELSKNEITLTLSLLKDYVELYRQRLTAKNLLYIRQLLSLATAFDCLLKVHSVKEIDTILTLQRFLVELNCSEIDLFKLLRYLDGTHLCKKLHGFCLRFKNGISNVPKHKNTLVGVEKVLQKKICAASKIETQTEKAEAAKNISSPMFLMKQFIESLTTKCDDARIIIERPTADHPARYKFVLLNPAEKLAEIVKETRSLILIGGTMEPVGHLLHSLNKVCEVPDANIMRFSCDHVIDDSQLIAITLGKAPDCSELTLSFGNRNKSSVLNGVAMILLNLLRVVTNGSIAFFPSYDYMAIFESYVKSNKLFDKISRVKPVLFETRKSVGTLWEDFASKARSNKGALLCAVVGGKLSEGINFSDELGRCVFMIGLPYSNKSDIELTEKMKYLDLTLGPKSGSELYETNCMHAVNQAIGRVIRHRHDYAAIILIDARYSRPSITQGLSRWIRIRLNHCNTFGEAVLAVSKFFQQRKKLEETKVTEK